MRILVVFMMSFIVSACSTTTSNVRDVMAEVDRSDLSYIRLAVTGERIQTSSQDSGRLYELHSSAKGILELSNAVAHYYGFTMVAPDEADFVLDIVQAVPDGGACVYGMEAARDNITYSTSVITFGVVPAKAAHCMVIVANLYAGQVAEENLIAEFLSNVGWVRIYAGAGELSDYRKTVTKRDEVKALEASFAGLLNELINEGAFK